MIPTMGGVDTMDSFSKGTGLLDQNENMSPGGMSMTTQQTMGQQNMYQSSRQDFMTSSVRHQSSFYTSGGQYRGGGANYSDSLYQKQANLSMLNTWDTNRLYLDEVFLHLLLFKCNIEHESQSNCLSDCLTAHLSCCDILVRSSYLFMIFDLNVIYFNTFYKKVN